MPNGPDAATLVRRMTGRKDFWHHLNAIGGEGAGIDRPGDKRLQQNQRKISGAPTLGERRSVALSFCKNCVHVGQRELGIPIGPPTRHLLESGAHGRWVAPILSGLFELAKCFAYGYPFVRHGRLSCSEPFRPTPEAGCHLL
jgi:hypothetical protein